MSQGSFALLRMTVHFVVMLSEAKHLSSGYTYVRRASTGACPYNSHWPQNTGTTSPFPLFHDFFNKFPNWLLIHPICAIDERVTVRVGLRSAVSPRHFIFRNIDP